MSDILVQAALREQAILTQQLIDAETDRARYTALQKATGYAGTAECDRVSIESFAWTPNCTCRLPDGFNRAGYVLPNWLCYDSPHEAVYAVNDLYCKTFGQFTKPRQNGLWLMDQDFVRCNRECNWCVPAGVSRVQVQMWGPGTGSSGACCQGLGTGGTNGAYSVIEFNVTQGDCLFLCAGCAQCCFGDASGTPGFTNGYCTMVCYYDNANGNATSITTHGGPEPCACRWNCSWCQSFGWNNCCSMQIGGTWTVMNNMDLMTGGGCMCSFGRDFQCIRGMQTCSSQWGTCYDGPNQSSWIPPHYDHHCGFCSPMFINVDCRNFKNVKHYGTYGVWPGFWVGATCCLGHPNNADSSSYHIQLPSVGFPNSWNIVSPDAEWPLSKQFGTTEKCCSQGCFSPMACHGWRRAPGVGGTGRFVRSPGTHCGDYGRAGAICVSWNCN
jgi:hypothetical protein